MCSDRETRLAALRGQLLALVACQEPPTGIRVWDLEMPNFYSLLGLIIIDLLTREFWS